MNFTLARACGKQLRSILRLTELRKHMENFPNIAHMLRAIYNSEDGLSLDVSKRLYRRAALSSERFGALESELKSAFEQPDFSWKEMLCNQEFEIYDAVNEEDAKKFAFEILWRPLFVESGEKG
ncbi:MAG: hypothetical protein QM759_04760 [Terricaulis sp.]